MRRPNAPLGHAPQGRSGLLRPTSDTSGSARDLYACLAWQHGAGLRDLDSVEGKNLVSEFRSPTRSTGSSRLSWYAGRSTLISAASSAQMEPARRATRAIAIFSAIHADPVGTGHVASRARRAECYRPAHASHRPIAKSIRAPKQFHPPFTATSTAAGYSKRTVPSSRRAPTPMVSPSTPASIIARKPVRSSLAG